MIDVTNTCDRYYYRLLEITKMPQEALSSAHLDFKAYLDF